MDRQTTPRDARGPEVIADRDDLQNPGAAGHEGASAASGAGARPQGAQSPPEAVMDVFLPGENYPHALDSDLARANGEARHTANVIFRELAASRRENTGERSVLAHGFSDEALRLTALSGTSPEGHQVAALSHEAAERGHFEARLCHPGRTKDAEAASAGHHENLQVSHRLAADWHREQVLKIREVEVARIAFRFQKTTTYERHAVAAHEAHQEAFRMSRDRAHGGNVTNEGHVVLAGEAGALAKLHSRRAFEGYESNEVAANAHISAAQAYRHGIYDMRSPEEFPLREKMVEVAEHHETMALVHRQHPACSVDAEGGVLQFRDTGTWGDLLDYEGPFHPNGHLDKTLYTWRENGERCISSTPKPIPAEEHPDYQRKAYHAGNLSRKAHLEDTLDAHEAADQAHFDAYDALFRAALGQGDSMVLPPAHFARHHADCMAGHYGRAATLRAEAVSRKAEVLSKAAEEEGASAVDRGSHQAAAEGHAVARLAHEAGAEAHGKAQGIHARMGNRESVAGHIKAGLTHLDRADWHHARANAHRALEGER